MWLYTRVGAKQSAKSKMVFFSQEFFCIKNDCRTVFCRTLQTVFCLGNSSLRRYLLPSALEGLFLYASGFNASLFGGKKWLTIDFLFFFNEMSVSLKNKKEKNIS